jgi:hypothetical protein
MDFDPPSPSRQAEQSAMAAHGILQRDYRTLEKARQDFRPQDFSGFPEFLDPPAAEERNAVGMLRGEVEIVQDGEHAVALLRQGASFGEQAVLMRGIEAGNRLAERFRIHTPQPALPNAVADAVKQIAEHFQHTGAAGTIDPAVWCMARAKH